MCSALFYLTANAAWGGTSEADSLRIRTMAFNKHLVTIDNDTGIKEYELLGTQRQQIRDIGN